MEGFKILSNSALHLIQRDMLSERLIHFNQNKIDGVSIDVCDDLSLVQSAQMTTWQRVRWSLARYSPWIKEKLFHINLAHTALSLELIEKQIAISPEKEKELLLLFRQAIDKFNRLSQPILKYEPSTLSIHTATLQSDLRTVIRLVTVNHAYLYLCNSHGETPLHIALKSGYLSLARFLITEHSKPKDLSIRDSIQGNTPLHLAVEANDFINTELLLRKRVDVTLTNFDHLTPLDLAQRRGYRELYQLLYEHKAKQHNGYFA